MSVGPFKILRVRAAVRKELRAQGYKGELVNDAIQVIDGDEILFAAEQISPEVVAAFTDDVSAKGPFLDWLGEFLKSPQGKILIDILVKFIIGLLLGLVGS